MRKTKIIATLGPVSNSPEMVKKLIETGMNAVRINFSHGSHESQGRIRYAYSSYFRYKRSRNKN